MVRGKTKKHRVWSRGRKRNTTKKKADKRIEPIEDTPENIARALFGLKRKEKKDSES